MEITVGWGLRRASFASFRDVARDAGYLAFRDRDEALRFLRGLALDAQAHARLRQLLVGTPHAEARNASGSRLMSLLAQELVHGRIVAAAGTLALAGAGAGGGQDDPDTPPDPPPPPPPPPVVKRLKLLRLDDHFAPSAESLDIVYDIEGLSGEKVTLEVTSPHAPSNPVFQRELTSAEKADGTRTLAWNGKSSATSGALADAWICPLWSPYTVKLSGGGFSGDGQFKVLYHSLALEKGPWTADEAEPPESDAKAWVAYKLNELGYYGGPVGKDVQDYLKKALLRYKANHKDLRRKFFPSYDTKVTPKLTAALKAGDNKRPEPDLGALTDESKTTILTVEALTYERLSASSDEFGQERQPHDVARLNRPLLPLEARLFLKSKSDAKTSAPGAVGPARINWRFTDPDEDVDLQVGDTAASPSKTKAYVEKALKLESGRTGQGDNCAVKFGGIRKTGADNAPTAFLGGDAYVPYKVELDTGQKCVFTKACVDQAKFPKRVGRAGIFFRPSYVAGDDYRVTAELDFTGLPNAADLEGFHQVTADVATRPHVRTGTFRIRRTARVATVVNWPARTNSEMWPEIAAEFAHAFNDVDVSGIEHKAMRDLMSQDEYRAIVTANTAHKDASKITLSDSHAYGLPLKAQGNLTGANYRKALKAGTWTNFGDKLQNALGNLLSDKVRKDSATGFVVCNFLVHPPVDIQTDPAHGDTSVKPGNVAYVTWGGSIGLPDSVILADQKDPDKVYYVVAHEMGHNFYLLHWENTGENNTTHHDTDDHDCIMSYSTKSVAFPFQAQGVYAPHFCGKCNLKLRGWKILAAGMPAKSS